MDFAALSQHHAILILTPSDRSSLFTAAQEAFPLPYHKHLEQTVLDIDTARDIASWARGAIAEENGSRACIISFHTITLPAQNALLKTLEEPKLGVRFILITSNKDQLLPTVLSRVQIVPHTLSGVLQHEAKVFLQTSPQERMKLLFIVELLARTDEEGRKDRESVKQFILSLIPFLQIEAVPVRHIHETLEIASYAADPSASGKALLEYLALLLPVIK